MRHSFRPEFLNRIDDVIVFNTLSRDNLSQIVDIQLGAVSKMVKDRKLNLVVTPAAKDTIINEGYDPQFGARPMRRAIQRLVQDPLAQKLLRGEFQEGETIVVDAQPGATELLFTKQEQPSLVEQ